MLVNDLLCANYDCHNQLTEWELKRIGNTKGLVRECFCFKCRRSMASIQFIRCVRCLNRIQHLNNKRTCNKCIMSSKKEAMSNWVKRKKGKQKQSAILENLRHKALTTDDLMKITGSQRRTINYHLIALRDMGFKIVNKSYWVLEE